MNALYLHIPYCKSRCGYCDFHTSTCMDDQEAYVDALCQELKQRQDYLPQPELSTIYFGGGTPSLLSQEQLSRIFDTIQQYYHIKADAEITLEANPDDINEALVRFLRRLGFNRLSIGIQSFDDVDLKTIGRRHNAAQAIDAVRLAQKSGFQNISIDLIFGLPKQNLEKWQKNLEQAFSLNIQHISSYNLIYEEGTPFYKKMKKGLLEEIDDESSFSMYQMLIETAEANGFIHYETSNFALPNYHSIHNSNYWKGQAYLGIGAGAHSYNGKSRRWNISDNSQYIKGINTNHPFFEIEAIDHTTAYNEFIMTGLRTMWGCSLTVLEERFGTEMLHYCMQCALPFLSTQQLLIKDNVLTIARDSFFISDQIMSELMAIS